MGYTDDNVNVAFWLTTKQRDILKDVARKKKFKNTSHLIRHAIKTQMKSFREKWPE